MPQIQILPAQPTFGSRLLQSLSETGEQFAKSIQQKRAKSALDKILNPQPSQPASGQANQPTASAATEISPMAATQVYDLAEKAYGPEAAKVMANSFIQQQKANQKEQAEIRKEQRAQYQGLRTKEMEKDIGRREALRKERADLQHGYNAVLQGDVGGFDINWLADRFGPAGEPLKTQHGVQLESAMKNLLVDTLQKTSGRPNQWIEQQIKSATPSIGKRKEANETLFKTALANNEIEERLLDTKDELIARYEQQGIPIPSNMDKIAHDLVQPYAQQTEEKLAYDLRVIYERSQGKEFLNNLKSVPPGTPLTIEKRDALMKKFGNDKQKVLDTARKLGYTIPKKNIIIREQQQEMGSPNAQ